MARVLLHCDDPTPTRPATNDFFFSPRKVCQYEIYGIVISQLARTHGRTHITHTKQCYNNIEYRYWRVASAQAILEYNAHFTLSFKSLASLVHSPAVASE